METLEDLMSIEKDSRRYQNIENKDCGKCDCHACIKSAICAPCGTCHKAINMCQWFGMERE